MKSSFVAIIGAAAAVSAQSVVPYTTSTVTATSVYTITSCAATVTNCPARLGQVTTEILSVYTTYCPVAAGQTTPAVSTPAAPYPTKPASGVNSTSTYLTTQLITISKCAPTVTNCPYTTAPITSTSIYAVPSPSAPAGGVTPSSPAGGAAPAPPAGGKSSVVVPPPTVPTSAPAAPPAPVLSTIAITTCVPTVITSVITVTPSAATFAPSSVPSGTVPKSPSSNSTIPFTGAASAQKAGGLLMAVGLVAALL